MKLQGPAALCHGATMQGEFRMVPCRLAGMEAVVARSRHCFPRHSHDHFGIGVIEQGGQIWHSRRGQVEAGPGSVISVSAGEVHDGAPVGDCGRTWRMLFIDPAVVMRTLDDLSSRAGKEYELARPAMANDRLASVVQKLFEAVTTDADDLERDELLITVLAAVGRKAHQRPPPPLHPQILEARNRIDDDPLSPVTLTELAGLVNLDRFQLLRGFKKATGLTPHAYLLEQRIKMARRRIARGFGLADTAAECGFADQSHMTRVFASRYGVTPGRYARVSAKATPGPDWPAQVSSN